MKYKYRISKYTVISEQKGSLFSIYSTRTGKHIVIDLGRYPVLQLLSGRKVFDERRVGPELMRALIEEGFVVAEGADELSECVKYRRNAFMEDYGLRLAILTTLNCNFACPYCFQENSGGDLTIEEKTKKRLLKFAESRFETMTKGPLVVTWFGGEPLLELDHIRDLTKDFKRLARGFDAESHFSMVTNGYFLDALTPAILEELDLSYIQVTLDGPRQVHDKRRPLKNGAGTYDKVIQNIRNASRHTDAITIRINVDKSNYRQVHLLLDDLKRKGILDRCTFHPAFVHDNTGACTATGCSTFKPKEWAAVDNLIYRTAKEMGIAERLRNRYPEPWALACSAQIENAFVVDPVGNLYKCLNDASIVGRAVSNINQHTQLNTERAAKLRTFSPFDRAECRACRYMPICNRGCPSASIDGNTEGHICTHHKYGLKDRLNEYLHEYLKGNG